MPANTDLWIPSDRLLDADPIAYAHVQVPHDPPNLTAGGIVLPDHTDEQADAAAAATVLAELDEDDDAGGETGACPDDDDVDDPQDTGPIDDV